MVSSCFPQDDFYLNLVDWSSLNVLAVGLGTCVYLWSACTSKVTKLCDLGPDDSVTSVSWTQRGTHLAVGTSVGEVQIWDAAKCQSTRKMGGHQLRVGTLCWSGHTLSSGSRDRLILQRDVRVAEHYTNKLSAHKQEVCGLKWSFDGQQLASGGNDNKLYIWSPHSNQPLLRCDSPLPRPYVLCRPRSRASTRVRWAGVSLEFRGKHASALWFGRHDTHGMLRLPPDAFPVARFNEHTAAVKAISWSPHQNGLLASGGGTADRCIRFWNTQTASALNCVDTGSQVCNLCWSKNINELVSTHGYSQNQIVVWRYSSMSKVATLTGHTLRVLYLAMSPDGQTIVTGAGDETLRFWNVFPGPKTKGDAGSSTSMLDFQVPPSHLLVVLRRRLLGVGRLRMRWHRCMPNYRLHRQPLFACRVELPYDDRSWLRVYHLKLTISEACRSSCRWLVCSPLSSLSSLFHSSMDCGCARQHSPRYCHDHLWR